MFEGNRANYLIQPAEIMLVGQILLLVLGLAVGLLVGQLSIFHIWLRYNNLSTFELIKLSRQVEEEENKNEIEQGK